MRGLLLFVGFLGLAVQGCSACSAVDEADLVPRHDAGGMPDAILPGVDSGPVVGPDTGPVTMRDAGSGMGLGDPNDCGGRTCDHLEVCLDSECECRSGRTRVGERCVDLNSDPDNCGEPGRACEGESVCLRGACEARCPDGATSCDGACVITFANVEHCGECGRRCDRAEYCWDGTCRPYTGGVGCTMCPCPTCTGDYSTCCIVAGDRPLVACIVDDRCPGG